MTATTTQRPTTEERVHALAMIDDVIEDIYDSASNAATRGASRLESKFFRIAGKLEGVRDFFSSGDYIEAGRLANNLAPSVQERVPQNMLATILTAYDNAMES